MSAPRIGVVGAGWWATQAHLPALAGYDGAELVAVADSNPDKLEHAARAFGVGRTFTDAVEMFDGADLDGVVVSVPHAHHYSLARAALDRGLHVLVEKPLALRAADAWDLVDRAARAQRHLSVGYTFQFTPAAEALRVALARGDLGNLLSVAGLLGSVVQSLYAGRPRDYGDTFSGAVVAPDATTYSDPQTSGGGQAVTQVTHAIGLVLHVTDLAPRTVMAFMLNADLPVDLVDAIAFDLSNGTVGTLASTGSLQSWQDAPQEIRYFGSSGYAVHNLVSGVLTVVAADGTTSTTAPAEGEPAYPLQRPAQAFADLLACIGPNLAPGRSAARAVEFVEACYRSAQHGRPIRLSGR